MRTLYIDGFFVFGLALTTVPVVGPSSPRFSMSLISVRTFSHVSAPMILGRCPPRKAPFAVAKGFCTFFRRGAVIAVSSPIAAAKRGPAGRGRRRLFASRRQHTPPQNQNRRPARLQPRDHCLDL